MGNPPQLPPEQGRVASVGLENPAGTRVETAHAVFFVLACALPWSHAYLHLAHAAPPRDFFELAQRTGQLLAAAGCWVLLALLCAIGLGLLRPSGKARHLARAKFAYLVLPAVALLGPRWAPQALPGHLLLASLGLVLFGSAVVAGEWGRASAALDAVGRRVAAFVPATDRGRRWLSIAVLLVFVLIFFRPVLTQGRILSPDGFLYLWPPFSSYTEGRSIDYNTITSDYADSLFPQYHLLYNAVWESHAFPLTNTHTLGNDNHATLLASHFFSIDALLSLLMGVPWGMTVAVLLRFWIGAVFCYLLLRELGAGHLSGIFAGVVFSFCSHSVVNAWLPLLFTLPMVIYGSERILRRPSYPVGFFLTATNVAILCAGQIVWSVHIVTVQLGYVMFRLLFLRASPQEKWKRLVALASAGVAALLLLAFLILPSFEQYEALDLGYRARNATQYHSHGFSLMLLFPEVSGPLNAPFQWGGNSVEYSFYVGLIPVLLFLLVPGAKRNHATGFFLAATVVIYAVITDAFGVLRLVQLVPFYGSSSNTRIRFMWSLTVAVAAAFGLDRLLRPERCSAGFLMRIVCTSGLVVAAGMGALWSFDHVPFLVHLDNPVIGGHVYLQIVALCVAIAMLGVTYTASARAPYGFLIVCMAFLDLYSSQAGYNPCIDADLSFPPTRLTDFLRKNTQSGGRIMPVTHAFISNFAEPYGIATVQPRGFYTTRQRELFQLIDVEALAHHPTMHFFGWNETKYDSALIDLLDVKYLLFMNGQVEEAFYGRLEKDWKRVYQDEVTVFENRGGYNDGFRVSEAELIAPGARVLDRLRQIDPRRVVLLEDPAALWPAVPGEAAALDAEAGRVERIHAGVSEVVYQTEGPRRGYGVFSRFFHPAWKAYVDGVRVPTYVADYVFLAIRLPAGRQRVELRFEPRHLSLGIDVSAGTALLLLGIAVHAARRSRASRRTAPRGPDGDAPIRAENAG